MAPFQLIPCIFLIAMCIGCSPSPTGSTTRSIFIVVPEQLAVGSVAGAQLVNQSGETVHIGAIPCGILTDQKSGDAWVELPPSSSECPQPVFTVATGATYSFAFRTPTITGTFRLRFLSQGDSVFSNGFAVQ